MTDNIKGIFDTNILLLGETDKAVIYIREQKYNIALDIVTRSVDQIKYVLNAIIKDQDYFNLVTTDVVLNMLTSILEANKNKDFILLADLLELQLNSFLESVQELIISKEEIVFNEQYYNDNMNSIMELGTGFKKELREIPNSEELLEQGYRVEFTSEGKMTLAACQDGLSFYFHTNSHVQKEAFLLARNWLSPGKKRYIIYGLGMAYHIHELQKLAPDAELEVYEADSNVVQLACAFADIKEVLSNEHTRLIYDPDYELIKKHLEGGTSTEALLIHYPSMRNIKDKHVREMMEKQFA